MPVLHQELEMFDWWTRWKRKRRLALPEPRELRSTLESDLWQWSYLPTQVQNSAVEWLRTFCAEKYWEGCNGFQLNDYHRWLIAAQASLMTLGFPERFFSGCQTLLIYPSDYVAPGITHMVDSQIGVYGEQPRSGQTSYRGPLILNWLAVENSVRGPNDGHNLTVHELAHQLDFDNGPGADGLPPLPPEVDPTRWYREFQAQLGELRDQVASGYAILLDDYGLTSPAELFAVSSELYFQLPHELGRWHTELFDLMWECYQVDWRRWLPDDWRVG